MKIIKRTFKAKEYPIHSKQRNKLNSNSVTSEYMTSYKYACIGRCFSFVTKIKTEAEAFKKRQYKED